MKKRLLSFLALLLLCAVAIAQNPVTIAKAISKRPSQSGFEISKAFDGNPATIYNSQYGQNAMPDTVDFYFVGAKSINKIDYTPRPSTTSGIWTTVDVYYATADAPSVFVNKLSDISWALTNTVKTIDMTASPIVKPYIVRLVIKAAGINVSTCAEINFSSAETGTLVSSDCDHPTGDLDTFADAKIQPTAVTGTVANETQRLIGYCIDGNLSSFYFSAYSEGVSQVKPVLMNFDFTGNNSMDYIKYFPRTDGGTNGNMGRGEIWYTSATQPTLTKLMDFDTGLINAASTFTFPSNLQNVTKIVIKVFSGVNNVVNCAEMEFHRAAKTAPTSSVFADDLYSTLKPGITQADIDAVVSPFFKSLAQCIFNNSYNRKYRVQAYDFYPNTATVEGILKTSGLNKVENPTGIAFKANTKAVVFVGNTYGVNPKLIIKDFALDRSATTDTYPLQKGMNIINVVRDGQAYISYFSDNAGLQPIQINIATGKVNGYYNPLTDTDEEWTKMLLNGVYPKLDIKGTYANLNIDKNILFSNSPNGGKDLVTAYDTIVHKEYILNGLTKYNRVPKNHMFLRTVAGDSNPDAGGDGVTYSIGTNGNGANLASAAGVLYDPWGVAHEFGHNNQVRPGAKWIGMTEVTNNINSAWIMYIHGSRYPNSSKLEKQAEKTKVGGPSVIGGRFSLLLDYSLIQKKHIQTPGNAIDAYIPLIPFWQLELYYQTAGACKNLPTMQQRLAGTPAAAGQPDVAFWYGDVLEKMRTTSQVGVNDGQLILNFVSATCDAVHEDLTDFFIKGGYLLPIDADISDYGIIRRLTITQAQIDALSATMRAKYPKPVSPVLNYISTNSVNTYKNRIPLAETAVATVGVTVNAVTLTIDNTKWTGAVAFETYNQKVLTDVAIYGAGDASSANAITTVQYGAGSTSVYAIGYDGSRKLVYPAVDVANLLPTVVITSPASDAVFTVGNDVAINATAADTDGTIAKVEFYQGSTLLGQSTTAPYNFTWTNPAAGNYNLTAKATDNNGGIKVSDTVKVIINTPPTVAINSPVNNAVFTAGTNLVIDVNAADTDGTISKVEYYQGSTLLGQSSSAPYSFSWNNLAAGTYALTAKAIDNNGGTTLSDTVKVIVNALPSIALSSPANNAVFTEGENVALNATASDTDGTVTKVEFYQGSNLLGQSNTAPYSFTWNNPAAGTYVLTAKATDNNGGITLSDTVKVTINSLPTVAISSPANHAVYTAGANVVLNAHAADADGTVAKLEFYQGSTLLGQSTTAPYGFTWNSPSTGNYNLTAKATDNNGGTTVSDTIKITVNTLPTIAISSPVDLAAFTAGTDLTINANATDVDGTVAKVEFYQGSTLLGQSATAPYSFIWTNLPVGTYALTAKATDNYDETTTSTAVNVTVSAAPTVSITAPVNNAAFAANSNITLNANTTGTIVKVEFYQGSTLLGQSTAAPYSMVWNNVSPGMYTLTAKATDNLGRVATSSIVNVKVNAPQALTVNPVADAFVRDGLFAGLNNGTSTTLDVSSDNWSFSKESYLRFDYSTFSGSVVNSAKIRVYASRIDFSPSRVVSVYGLSNTTWAESTITWNNKPAETGTLLGSYTVTNTGRTWYELDVTAYINSQLALGKRAISIKLVNQGPKGFGNLVSFNSREAASNKPELLLNQEASTVNLEESPISTNIGNTIGSLLGLKITAWPNPSTTGFKVQVESPSSEALQYRVYNIAQQLVKEAKIAATEQLTFGAELPAGIYMVEVRQGTERKVVKVIKL